MFGNACRGRAKEAERAGTEFGEIKRLERLTNNNIPKLSTDKYLQLWITQHLGLSFRCATAFI
jgi:hypothetical protein